MAWGWRDRQADGKTDGWMDGQGVEGLWTHDVMVRWIDGQTDEQTNRQMDEWATPIMDLKQAILPRQQLQESVQSADT